MKEVKKCSISSVAFTMDADAHQALADYLDSLKKTYKESPDGAEIIADIEARIAELILSAQDSDRVVEKPLILNIIRQMGSAEDISEQDPEGVRPEEPRIPRRLYRDTENAKLGGVCAGIGKYFDIDPVWVRLGMFLPLLVSFFHWIPFLDWTGPMMGNLFGIFLVCYVIMWFAVPAARTARQKLEMTGEKITAQSIRETTEAASNDVDAKAKPVVADVVTVFGQVVLIMLKIFAGFMVFGLILTACALVIGLFVIGVGGPEYLHLDGLNQFSIWIPILGIFIALIPVMLLIYVMMCLIASRKPGSKTVVAIFILWLASIIACACIAIHDDVAGKLRNKHERIVEKVMETPVEVNDETMTLRELLDDDTLERIIEEDEYTMHISIPSKSIAIMVDKLNSSLTVEADGKKINITTSEGEKASVKLMKYIKAADDADRNDD